MFSKPIQNLIDFFVKFPGVGPKQATRFVFYLLREDPKRVEALAEAITKLQEEVEQCQQCYKTFDVHASRHGAPKEGMKCEFCRDAKRNQSQILVVEKEVDLANIEKTRKYDGLYHILGGTINPLDSSAPVRLHLKELFERVQKIAQAGASVEVILATNPTAEGEASALYIERILNPLKNYDPGVKISRLGRGLNTGSELEYSDAVTITNALENRK